VGLQFAVCVLTVVVLMARGETPRQAVDATALGFSSELLHESRHADSWDPMLLAYESSNQTPNGNPYTIFFRDRVKFQYPPSSLLVLDLFPQELLQLIPSASPLQRTSAEPFRAVVGRASQMAAIATIMMSLIVFEIGVRRHGLVQEPPRVNVVRVLFAMLLGATFYPLLKGHSIGQIQVFLNALVSCALLSQLFGRQVWTGACIGLCCLIKPQFALVLLWAALRRNWGLVGGMAAVLCVGMALSIARFGWPAHLEYITVLQAISRVGEAYWPNQSLNGVLNRFLYNGDPIAWEYFAYAPFNGLVHFATVLSSLLLVGLALLSPRNNAHTPSYQLVDLTIVLLVATMASPVAWEHHYGILLPVLAVAAPLLMAHMPLGHLTGPLLLTAFLGGANIVLRPELLFVNRWLGLAASHLFASGLILVGLLVATRSVVAHLIENREIGHKRATHVQLGTLANH
jgi:hypothetical protein